MDALFQIKSLLYTLYYGRNVSRDCGPISASLHSGNTALFEEISQRWRAVGSTESGLTARDLNLRPPTLETNALPLDQLAGIDAF